MNKKVLLVGAVLTVLLAGCVMEDKKPAISQKQVETTRIESDSDGLIKEIDIIQQVYVNFLQMGLSSDKAVIIKKKIDFVKKLEQDLKNQKISVEEARKEIEKLKTDINSLK